MRTRGRGGLGVLGAIAVISACSSSEKVHVPEQDFTLRFQPRATSRIAKVAAADGGYFEICDKGCPVASVRKLVGDRPEATIIATETVGGWELRRFDCNSGQCAAVAVASSYPESDLKIKNLASQRFGEDELVGLATLGKTLDVEVGDIDSKIVVEELQLEESLSAVVRCIYEKGTNAQAHKEYDSVTVILGIKTAEDVRDEMWARVSVYYSREPNQFIPKLPLRARVIFDASTRVISSGAPLRGPGQFDSQFSKFQTMVMSCTKL